MSFLVVMAVKSGARMDENRGDVVALLTTHSGY